jgi:hypothetical protein
MTTKPERLPVLFDGVPVGAVDVKERTGNKILGHFVLEQEMGSFRILLDQSTHWARIFDQSHESPWLDYEAFDNYLRVTKEMTTRIKLPGIAPLKEFSLDHLLHVEITLASGQSHGNAIGLT